MATTQPIRSKKEIRALANYFLQKGQPRNHLLVVLGLHTALRISDLLHLRWEDVYDFDRRRMRVAVELTESKTRKTKIIALNKAALGALELYAPLAAAPGRFLIENPRTKRPISRIQAYRIIHAASQELAFQIPVSCHSLRKTFGYHAWKSGVSPAVIMEIYNHNSLAVTRRYLGVSQDDKNQVYQKLALLA